MVGFEVGADVQLLVDADDQEDGEADEDADFKWRNDLLANVNTTQGVLLAFSFLLDLSNAGSF